jgi:hypothetical protein
MGSLLLAQPEFPELRVSTVLQHGEWLASPIVAVGEITNIASYGEQAVANLPYPMSPDVHWLYWCEGDFSAVAVVKGALPDGKRKYLWASGLPGWRLWDDNPDLIFHREKMRVWFVREDGGYLRPTFDMGTAAGRFFGLFARWEDLPDLPARQRLGTLLLTPSANSDSLDDYAKYIWGVGDIACDLLGKSDCALQIKGLAGLGNPALRDAACNFLKGQLNDTCSSN